MKSTTIPSDSEQPFDKIPDEILQYLLSFTNHEGALVSRRFLVADREIIKNEARESFSKYLTTRAINFSSVNPLLLLHYLIVFALCELPMISDPLKKSASIGILLLQLYEVMYFCTRRNQLDFTLQREPDVLTSSLWAVSYMVSSNDESDSFRTSISQQDLDSMKNLTSDMLAYLVAENANLDIQTNGFDVIVKSMLLNFNESLTHTINNTSCSYLCLFSFLTPENQAQKLLRLTRHCVSLLERQVHEPRPNCVLF